MATIMIKSTYSLDVDTVRQLDRMAKHLGISKSEAMRRAIRLAAKAELAPGEEEVEALDELQISLGLTKSQARDWEKSVQSERLAASHR